MHAALVRPVHLFVEKPVATTLGDAEAILALATRAGVVHSAGYVYGHLPVVAAARELLAAGVLGEVLRFSAHAYVSEVFGEKRGWFFEQDLAGGGVVANMASHLLFILGWFLIRHPRLTRRVNFPVRSNFFYERPLGLFLSAVFTGAFFFTYLSYQSK